MKFGWKFLIFCSLVAQTRASQITLAWDKSPDAVAYRIYYGVASGAYTNSISTGDVSQMTVGNLLDGVRYFFAATALDAQGLESVFSNEVTAVTPISTGSSFSYSFNSTVPGRLDEAAYPALSWSPYWWLQSGGEMLITTNGYATTIEGDLPSWNPWHESYATNFPVASDQGDHPQNMFRLLTRQTFLNADMQIYVRKDADNLTNAVNVQAYNGISLFLRYLDNNNHYYAGIRNDGYMVIKKRLAGSYKTLAASKVFAGSYDPVVNPSLIPKGIWLGLRAVIATNAQNTLEISFYLDKGETGSWTLLGTAIDDPTASGPALASPGVFGVQSSFMDASLDNFKLSPPPIVRTAAIVQGSANEPPIQLDISLADENWIILTVSGPIGAGFVLEAADDLRHWNGVSTNYLDSSPLFFSEPIQTGGRFYKIWETGKFRTY